METTSSAAVAPVAAASRRVPGKFGSGAARYVPRQNNPFPFRTAAVASSSPPAPGLQQHYFKKRKESGSTKMTRASTSTSTSSEQAGIEERSKQEQLEQEQCSLWLQHLDDLEFATVEAVRPVETNQLAGCLVARARPSSSLFPLSSPSPFSSAPDFSPAQFTYAPTEEAARNQFKSGLLMETGTLFWKRAHESDNLFQKKEKEEEQEKKDEQEKEEEGKNENEKYVYAIHRQRYPFYLIARPLWIGPHRVVPAPDASNVKGGGGEKGPSSKTQAENPYKKKQVKLVRTAPYDAVYDQPGFALFAHSNSFRELDLRRCSFDGPGFCTIYTKVPHRENFVTMPEDGDVICGVLPTVPGRKDAPANDVKATKTTTTTPSQKDRPAFSYWFLCSPQFVHLVFALRQLKQTLSRLAPEELRDVPLPQLLRLTTPPRASLCLNTLTLCEGTLRSLLKAETTLVRHPNVYLFLYNRLRAEMIRRFSGFSGALPAISSSSSSSTSSATPSFVSSMTFCQDIFYTAYAAELERWWRGTEG
jgi:hypothetical protein